MSWVILFHSLLFSTVVLAFWYGSRPEKLAAIMMVLASGATVVARALSSNDFYVLSESVFLIDMLLLAGFLYVALRFDRHWALWVAGFHIVAVVTQTAIVANPDVAPGAYARGIVVWSYLDVFALAAGIWFEARPEKLKSLEKSH